jgi:hypothetical protein
MNERSFRLTVLLGAAALYVVLFGYGLWAYDRSAPPAASSATPSSQERPPLAEDPNDDRTRRGGMVVIPPRVVAHDADVSVYERRTVRATDRRGGGLRGGK